MDLKTDVGPFPVWGWLVIIVGGVGAGILLPRLFKGGAAASTSETAVTGYQAVGAAASTGGGGGGPTSSVTSGPPYDAPPGFHWELDDSKNWVLKADAAGPGPTPPPVAGKTTYPGFPAGFVATSKDVTNWNGITLVPQPGGNEFAERNAVAMAIKNSRTPWIGGGAGRWQIQANADLINRQRVSHGLYPLTAVQFGEMEADWKAQGGQGPMSRKLTETMFYKWNKPFQIPRGETSRGRG